MKDRKLKYSHSKAKQSSGNSGRVGEKFLTLASDIFTRMSKSGTYGQMVHRIIFISNPLLKFLLETTKV